MRPTTVASAWLPSEKTTTIWPPSAASATTWLLVRIMPSSRSTNPEPEPSADADETSIETVLGSTLAATPATESEGRSWPGPCATGMSAAARTPSRSATWSPSSPPTTPTSRQPSTSPIVARVPRPRRPTRRGRGVGRAGLRERGRGRRPGRGVPGLRRGDGSGQDAVQRGGRLVPARGRRRGGDRLGVAGAAVPAGCRRATRPRRRGSAAPSWGPPAGPASSVLPSCGSVAVAPA